MALRPVLQWPDPRLATVCTPVAPGEDMAALAAEMLEVMYAAPGRGLAAPQIGVLKRLFVMDVSWKEGTPAPYICLNPVIESWGGHRVAGPEGCLSIPGILTEVTRATEITLVWTDLQGMRQRERLTGFAAICAQHENDHLDGLVTFDRLTPVSRAKALKDYAA